LQERDDFWGAHSIASRVQVFEEKELVLFENLALSNNVHGSISSKLGGAAVFGMIVLSGPQTVLIREELQCLAVRRSFRDQRAESLYRSNDNESHCNTSCHCLVSVANLTSNTTLVRFSAPSVEYSYCLLLELLRPLEQMLGSVPYAERKHYEQLDVAQDHPHDPIRMLRELRQSKGEICPHDSLDSDSLEMVVA
jgi:hypothetical protein